MSTTHHQQAEAAIQADPTVPAIHITRDFAATAAQLVRAHTDPELFVRWIGPAGYVTTIDHWDARTGGSYRYEHEGQGFHGCFHHVSDERLVQTFTWEGMPEGVSLDTMTFEDLGDGRTRLRITSLVGSFEDRDGMLSSGMDVGVNDGYAKLDALLADGAVE